MTTKREFQDCAVQEALTDWLKAQTGKTISPDNAGELRQLLNKTQKFAGEWWEMFLGPQRLSKFRSEPVGTDGLELIKF